MPVAGIEIRGVEEAIEKLGSLERVEQTLEPVINTWVNRGVGDMQDYPPELPNQRYRRTFVLRGGWTGFVHRLFNGIQGVIRNADVPYNIWVQAQRLQAAIHRGRWTTEEQWARDNEGAILRDADQAIEEAAR